MSDNKQCILMDYKTDKCSSCDELCQHRIALHGFTGDTGRVGNAGIPKDYQYVTLGNSPARNDQKEIYDVLARYVETFRRTTGERVKSLYLWSDSPGTGKTTTATALINAWIAAEYLTAIQEGRQPGQSNAYFLDVNEFQSRYNLATMTDDKEGMRKIAAQIIRAQKASFAVIDDIGVRNATDAFRAYVHMIINHRTTHGLPTVFTSNLPIKDMTTIYDDRLYDRMRDQLGELHFGGASKRGRR